MKKSMKSLANASLLVLSFVGSMLPLSANASVIFNLNGFVNGNPSQPNLAVLKLQDSYVSGAPILASDFESFQLVGPNWVGGLWAPPVWSVIPTGNPFSAGPGVVLNLVSSSDPVQFIFSGGVLQEYFQQRALQFMSDVVVTDVTPRPSSDNVPEPSTIALIGMAFLSLFGFGMMRRRAEA